MLIEFLQEFRRWRLVEKILFLMMTIGALPLTILLWWLEIPMFIFYGLCAGTVIWAALYRWRKYGKL